VVIAANLAGSIEVTRDDDGERIQDAETVALSAWLEGERDDPPSPGLACSQWSPCLEAAWYLRDERLGPFRGAEPSPPTLVLARDEIYRTWHAAPDDERIRLCAIVVDGNAGDIEGVVASNGVLSDLMVEPAGEQIVQLFDDTITTKCLSFEMAGLVPETS
jgi:hypothetical protein